MGGEDLVDDVLGPRPDWLGDEVWAEAQGLAGDDGEGGRLPFGDVEEGVEGGGEQGGGCCREADLGGESTVEGGDLGEGGEGEEDSLGDAETFHYGLYAVAFAALVDGGCGGGDEEGGEAGVGLGEEGVQFEEQD